MIGDYVAMSVVLREESTELQLAVKTFIMRGSDRDVKLDHARRARLVEAVEITMKELVAERDGLVARVKQTINQPGNVSKKILGRPDTPTTAPVTEFRRAEKRLNLLAKQIRDLEKARALFLQWT